MTQNSNKIGTRGIFLVVASLAFCENAIGACVPITCDPEVSSAMMQHSSALERRLDDFLRGVRQISRTFDSLNQVCTLEALELIKLKARKRIEAEKQVEISARSVNLRQATEKRIK